METKKYYDQEEQELMESIDKGEFVSVPKEEQNRLNKNLNEATKNYFKKDKQMNLRMNGHDILKLKRMATYEGLPYQTYIASQLHKLAEGRLKEVDQ